MSDTARSHSTLSFDEVREIFDHLQARPEDPHVLAAFALPTMACLRRSELLNLQAEHIDEDRRCIYLGTMRPRVVTYSESLRPAIRALKAVHANGPLFDGTCHLDRALRRIRRAASELGIEKPVTYRSLRNTFMKLMVQAGIDMFTILAFAGIRTSHICQSNSLAGSHHRLGRDLLAYLKRP